MRMKKEYAKLFFDTEKANEFAREVEIIARRVTVPAGKSDNLYYVFRSYGGTIETLFREGKPTQPFHLIEKVEGSENAYYVRYRIHTPQDATRADMLRAQREIEAYLNQKYAELGPDTGVSRA